MTLINQIKELEIEFCELNHKPKNEETRLKMREIITQADKSIDECQNNQEYTKVIDFLSATSGLLQIHYNDSVPLDFRLPSYSK